MKQPIFRKYCTQPACITHKWKLRPKGDGYKQECPVCGTVYDPEDGMTKEEKNQYMMGDV